MFNLFKQENKKASIDQLYEAYQQHPELFNPDEILDYLFWNKLQEVKQDLKDQGYLNN
tara:strand:+ start:2229 stop:2402 length:174 start_codon:yes stop_codon:yes gene_type:complete